MVLVFEDNRLLTLPREARIDPVVRADSADTLAAVRDPGVALALWARRLPGSLAEAIAALELGAVDDLELTVDLPASVSALAASLVVSGHAPPVARLLAADILELASRHAVICGEARVAIRLEVVDTDACRRFHTDYTTLRLLTTYRGQATQWIRVGSPDRIEQMAAGEIGIFKGRRLLDDPSILHRSPPIGDRGESRLLLVIDPVIAE
jgi:hypothetical protein